MLPCKLGVCGGRLRFAQLTSQPSGYPCTSVWELEDDYRMGKWTLVHQRMTSNKALKTPHSSSRYHKIGFYKVESSTRPSIFKPKRSPGSVAPDVGSHHVAPTTRNWWPTPKDALFRTDASERKMERKETQLEIFQNVGCLVTVQVPMPKKVKIEPKTVDCMFIGYSKSNKAYFITFLLENEPQTFKEAMSLSDSSFWKETVNSEIDSILSNYTWELVDLPPENKSLGSKWIFKRKMKVNGTIDKYKTRLVVKGFKQKEGLDYFDTYSPVTRITSIRMLIALAAVYDLEIHQMDVKTSFLNRELEKEIYMEQPGGFVVPGKENNVCKLIKSLYGLKKTPKQWHAKFDQTMLANRFKINECNKCVYIKDTPNHQVIVCLYVDDMLIISRDISDINATKRMLESKFDMKDLGVADVILGIRIHRTPQGLALSQSHYIENVLEKFKYMEFGIAKTPLDVIFVLQKNEESEFIALDKAGEEAEWLRNFLEDIPYWPKPVAPVCINCDSQATIGRAGSMMYNNKSRHVRRRHNTVRELLSSGIITVDYVKSKDHVPDPLTKGLSREGVGRTSKEMSLRPRTSQHGGNST
ncbi:hypothetical protein FXO38_11555 [Capsicum annuum]|nr:hypothetical protein FXO38_11555 [Capsicum annuum]KAF3663869.1 hypothetical protein FXO37_11787 [Capsicum annuum]